MSAALKRFPAHTRLVRMPKAPGYTPGPVRHVRNPKDVHTLLGPLAAAEDVEVFWVVALNSQAQVVAYTELTRGLLNCSLVNPREVFRWALANDAAGIIVAHNHPSGNTTPSNEDRAVTKQLVAAGRVIGVRVDDHLILTADKFFSFAEAGLL